MGIVCHVTSHACIGFSVTLPEVVLKCSNACLYGKLKSMDSTKYCVHLSIPCQYQLSEEYVNCGIILVFGVLHCYCWQCPFTGMSLYQSIVLQQTCVRVRGY
jgi:hypothetical protein